MQNRLLISTLLWIWVAVAFLGYLHQFRDEAAAVSRMLGMNG